MAPLSDLTSLLEKALDENAPFQISDGGVIRDGYDAEIDEYRNLRQHGKEYLAKLQNEEIQKTGIQTLKIKSNNVFGYFFEVPKGQIKNVPEYFIRKQTLVNAERYITPELKEYEEKVFSAETKLLQKEQEIFTKLQKKALEYTAEIQKIASAIGELDLLFSFAKTANRRRYTKPKFSGTKKLRILRGRHPVVESMQENEGSDRFVPNDLEMGGGSNSATFCLVTGPNMAGKSTFLRQNALLILMAHMGSFVPAEEAEIPIVDRIFTRIGSGDILSKGQSTFLVEMQEASHILRNATENSFIILDEIGRGTSTFDGLSLAWAITEDLESRKIKTLFATHYHELIDLVESLKKGKNLSVAVLENDQGVTFLHRIIEGGASKSFGIEVARLAGIPEKITERAKEILQKLEDEEIVLEPKSRRVRKKKNDEHQQKLFPAISTPEKKSGSEIEKVLKTIDINHLTPMEALQKLFELKKNIEENDE
ncbi:DNA mismatch repair protein MutS [Candidatus Peregrinibacteria bacterium]|nr:DNA mismatch repair protein MutS [Candidatus Peregrinibacteria bacterium]